MPNPMLLPAIQWDPAPPPENEAARLQTLRSLCVLDTPKEAAFDNITAIGAALFSVPVMLVSLVDEHRQFFKSAFGMLDREAPRNISFCADTLLSGKHLVVLNAATHPRFGLNPYVQEEPHIRFYAGAPLRMKNGLAVGTLCAIDFKPRLTFSPDQITLLTRLADVTAELLELRATAMPRS